LIAPLTWAQRRSGEPLKCGLFALSSNLQYPLAQ
jgi:hypothetical protein